MSTIITPISKADCNPGRAGISVIWATNCINVLDLTFNVSRQITAITMDTTQDEPVFIKIEFEKDTAFFNQEKTRNKSSINVVQTISFIEPGLGNTVRNALQDLNGNCCVLAIVRDNAGNYHVAGLSHIPATDEFWFEDMRTGEGSSNTGADPTADSAEYVETLVCNVNFYAPFTTLTSATIPD